MLQKSRRPALLDAGSIDAMQKLATVSVWAQMRVWEVGDDAGVRIQLWLAERVLLRKKSRTRLPRASRTGSRSRAHHKGVHSREILIERPSRSTQTQYSQPSMRAYTTNPLVKFDAPTALWSCFSH